MDGRDRIPCAKRQRVADVAEMLLEAGGPGVTDTLQSMLASIASCPSEDLGAVLGTCDEAAPQVRAP
jgi:hypothetical protein